MAREPKEQEEAVKANLEINKRLNDQESDSTQHNPAETEATAANNRINAAFNSTDDENDRTSYIYNNTPAIKINKDDNRR